VSSIEANRLVRICAYSAEAPEWEQLVRLIVPVVGLAARRVGAVWGDRSTQTANEIVQEVFLKLCEDERRVLREFASRDGIEFLQLLRVITATAATDHFRRLTADKRGGSAAANQVEPHAVADELHDWRAARAMELPFLFAQLDGLLRLYPSQVSARDRKLFWLHYSDGLSAKAIARMPGMSLSAKGVESALIRLRRILRHTVLKGKPKPGSAKIKLSSRKKIKGFSSPVTINNIESP